MGFDAYKDDRIKRDAQRYKEILDWRDMKAQGREALAADPVRRTIQQWKGGQGKGQANKKAAITLPKLKFMEGDE